MIMPLETGGIFMCLILRKGISGFYCREIEIEEVVNREMIKRKEEGDWLITVIEPLEQAPGRLEGERIWSLVCRF